MSSRDRPPPADREPFSLRRWSQRKRSAQGALIDAATGSADPAPSGATAPPPAAATPDATGAAISESGGATLSAQDRRPETTPATVAAAGEAGAPNPTGSSVPPLPAIDQLTFDSDFAAFLTPRIDETLKRAALKKLFQDPRFNVMDGLDVYVDDYTQFESMTPEIVRGLAHARALFDPPTMVADANGHAVEVPAAEPGSGEGSPTARPADEAGVPATAAPVAQAPELDAGSDWDAGSDCAAATPSAGEAVVTSYVAAAERVASERIAVERVAVERGAVESPAEPGSPNGGADGQSSDSGSGSQ